MNCSIVWLRDDLRLADNPALNAAVETGEPVMVVFILDEVSPGIRPLGSATKWWLHHSLVAFGDSLEKLGSKLILRAGESAKIINELVNETGAKNVFWNRRYGKPERDIDSELMKSLRDKNIAVDSFHANLLFEPWDVRTGNNGPYTVFTPFWKNCINQQPTPRLPFAAPSKIASPKRLPGSEDLNSWNLLPAPIDWAKGFEKRWTPGEVGGHTKLNNFFKDRIKQYADGRDFMSLESTSELSPHLRWGEVSPFQIWNAAEQHRKTNNEDSKNVTKFLAEVGWREFSYHLHYHWPDLATKNFDSRFDHFPWAKTNAKILRAWQRGRTGIELVDAGMNELWQTGYMHNRARMVVASFLIKNLLHDWRLGEEWFWDTLVDADSANNAASWQWVAGSGADAAPYFRVFNPELQAEKFDPEGKYRNRYLGEERVAPIVDLGESRKRALEAFGELSEIPRSIRPQVVDY